MPSSKLKIQNIYWRQLSIRYWKNIKKNGLNTAVIAPNTASTSIIDEKLDLLFLLNNFYRNSNNSLPSNLSLFSSPILGASSLASSSTFVPQNNLFRNKTVAEIAATIYNSSTSPTIDATLNNSSDAYSQRRLSVESNYRDWSLLLPNYCPLKYSKPIAEFQREIQHCVQDHSLNASF